ncbi:MAG: hypothetical protein QNI96_08695 [Woeseiaceae bacterium]|nr:hypothetical protein [Woeseiaceae bacterium]
MQFQRLSLLLASFTLAGIAWPGSQPTLTIIVPPAVAPVQPLAEGRRLVRLPALEFEFGIEARCGPEQAVRSISISVADTRKTLESDDIPEVSIVSTAVTLPARQLAPVAVDGFCPESQVAGSSLLLRDAVTAQVSLRCTGEDGDSITYASQPLDVTLVCEIDPDVQGVAPASSDM